MRRMLVGFVSLLMISAAPLPSGARDVPLGHLPADAIADAFVVFDVGFEHGLELVRDAGLPVGTELRAADAIHTWGPVHRLRALAAIDGIGDVQRAGAEPVLLSTATWASRARAVYEGTLGLDFAVTTPTGEPIDGRGVGIAIIDTGIDATHPDLRWAGFGEPGPKTLLNMKVACSNPLFDAERFDVRNGCFGPAVLQDVPNSDTTSGHGTHVAGIAAATGVASDGAVRGAAPGAALYGFGTGEGRSVLTAAAAASMQWIYDNGHTLDPPIKVLNGSYGAGGAFNPDFVLDVLATKLVTDRGITVVWGAGNGDALNEGGDGADDRTTQHSKNPTPGVLSVANYDDANVGTRDNALSATSSRGAADDPATWPDLAAPGTFIDSTCTPPHAFCTSYPPSYGFATGTSMAAPHAAGIAALLYQADPTISPAGVERVLERAAYEFTAGAAYEPDPTNGASMSSFDKGHGLVDARAAVLDVLGLPADHGVGPGVEPGTREIWIADDADEVPDGAKDLLGAGVSERADGSIRMSWRVRDASEIPPNGAQYRMVGSSGAVAFDVWVSYGESLTPNPSNPVPTSTWRDGDTFHALFTAEQLGAARGELLAIRYAGSYFPLTDYVPGGILTDATVRPGYVPRYAYSGPSA